MIFFHQGLPGPASQSMVVKSSFAFSFEREKIFGRKSIARQIGHSCLIVYINQIMADYYQFKGDVIQISLHSSLSADPYVVSRHPKSMLYVLAFICS